MSEFAQMKQLLEDTGLYDVTDGSLIKAELMAYAAGLDTYFDALDSLKRECFVATAEDYGLQYRENLLRQLNLLTTTAGRRNALLKAFSLTNADNTQEGLEKIRDSFNAHGTFSYDAASMTLTFTCTDTLTAEQRTLLEQQFPSYLPAWCFFTLS